MMRGYGYGPGFGHAFGPGFGLIGGLFTLLLIAAVVVLLIALLRHRGVLAAWRPRGAVAGANDALAIAQRRFANGEISREQYEEIRDTLTPPAATPPAPTV